MKKNPQISIIIPVYNGEKHLEKALNSALNQSLENLEIILIDDGSTDKTSDIITQYAEKDSRIVALKNPQNKGLSYSRNLGIEKAKGEYLFFLDADDYLHPNAMESLYDQAKKDKLDVLQSKYILKTGKTKKILPEDLELLPAPVDGISYFHQNFFVSPTVWAKLYNTGFIKKEKIRFKDHIYEDMPFSFEAIYKAKRIANNMMPAYIYQKQAGSITSRHTEQHFQDYLKVLKDLQAYFMNPQMTDSLSTFPVHFYLFMARLSDNVIKYGNKNQQKEVKKAVENLAKKYKQFISPNKRYPFLKRMLLQSSPYNYSLLSQTFKKKKHSG